MADELAKLKVEVEADLKKINKEIDKLKTQLEKSGKEGAEKFSKGFLNNMKSFATRITAVAGAVGILKKAWDFAKDAATLNQLRKTFDRLANNEGLNAKKLMLELKDATSGTVAEMKLLQTVNKGKFLGVDLKAMPTLLEFATIRAKETGESIDYLVDSIITGIGRKSPLILDNLGLTMKELDAAIIKVAASQGKVIKQVGEIERAQYLTQAAVLVAKKAIDNTSTSTNDFNTKIDRMKTKLSDLSIRIGTKFLPIAEKTIDSLNKWADTFDRFENSGGLDKLIKFLSITTSPFRNFGNPDYGKDFLKKIKDEYGIDLGTKPLPTLQELGVSSPITEIQKELHSERNALEELIKKQKEFTDKAIANNTTLSEAEKKAAEALQEKISDAFDKVGFLSDKYFNYRTKQIEKEAELIAKLTGDSIAAKQYEIDQKKKLEADYIRFKIDQQKQEELQRRAAAVVPQLRTPNAKSFFDYGYREPVPVIKEDNPALIKIDTELRSINTMHNALISTASDFGNALENAFSRSGDSFIAKLNQALQIALNIANAVSAANKKDADPLSSIFSVLGSVVSIATLFAHDGGTFVNSAGKLTKVKGYAAGGSFTVPPGYPRDSYPLLVESGEKVKVTPAHRSDNSEKLLSAISAKLDGLRALNANVIRSGGNGIVVINNSDSASVTVEKNKRIENRLIKKGYKFDG